LKRISWRTLLVLGITIIAVVYILPSFPPALWPHKKINLGLDLQGGMHLVLEVDTIKAVESTVERIAQELRTQIREERIPAPALDRIDGAKISVKISGAANIEKFQKLLDKD
jgi:preprotein translocase subunit SecD